MLTLLILVPSRSAILQSEYKTSDIFPFQTTTFELNKEKPYHYDLVFFPLPWQSELHFRVHCVSLSNMFTTDGSGNLLLRSLDCITNKVSFGTCHMLKGFVCQSTFLRVVLFVELYILGWQRVCVVVLAYKRARASVCGCVFVCVEILRPSQPIGVMSSAVSLPNCIFTWAA